MNDNLNTSLDINDILLRIARYQRGDPDGTEKVTDAVLARELNVSRQSLAGWKKRNTIPWEKLWEYSVKHELSMNYVLTGEWEDEHHIPLNDREISVEALEVIGGEVLEHAQVFREKEGVEFASFLTGPSAFHAAATIYNRLLKLMPWEGIPIEEICKEAEYAVNVASSSHRDHIKWMKKHHPNDPPFEGPSLLPVDGGEPSKPK